MSMTSDPAANVVGLPSVAPGQQPLAPHASPQEIDAYVNAHYGYMAWALAVPELRGVIEQAFSAGNANGVGVDTNTFAGLVRATKWYQQTTAAARQFAELAGEDPATANAQMEAKKAEIRQAASLLGLSLSQPQLDDLGNQAMAFQWQKPELDQALLGETTRQYLQTPAQATPSNPNADPYHGGQLTDYYSQVQNLAREYMVSIDPNTAGKWAAQLATGQLDTKSVEGSLIDLARGKFPGLAATIESGITPRAYFQPIQTEIAKTLEVTPDQVKLGDPKYSPVLQYADPSTNVVRPMTISEATNWARSQPEWATTRAANDQSAQLVKSLSSAFGAAKY